MARPRAGDWLFDEVMGWRVEGIDTVVSLLQADEVRDLGLEPEGDLCLDQLIDFISFPIPDRGVPSSIPDAKALIQSLAERVRDGRIVAVHCRAGIGRSSLVAACILVDLGIEPERGWVMIERARGLAVPDTEEQVRWLGAFDHSGRRD
jgi:protein-tyrosine phosphatase